MANLGGTFNTSDAPENEFAPLPEGNYMLQAIESSIGPNSNGTGTILKITYEVLDEGPYKNRRVWDNLNVQHENATAQGIAQRALASLCEALGFGQIDDTDQLHFKPFVAQIATQVGKGTFPDKSVIKKYLKADGTMPDSKRAKGGGDNQAAAPDAKQPAPAPQRSTGARPWGSRAG